jgi:tetratricopeptide (TPR) repeat protein
LESSAATVHTRKPAAGTQEHGVGVISERGWTTISIRAAAAANRNCRLDAADCLRVIGDYQGSKGHMEQAIATYERTLNILRQLGEHEKTGAVLNNMAINFANEGKLDQAEQFYRQAESHFRQAGDKGNTSTAISNIADILYLRGNLAGAAKGYQQSLDMAASDAPGADSYSEYRLADLELTRGEVKKAHDRAAGAVQSVRPNQGDYASLSGALLVLGESLMYQGDLKGARQNYEEALAIRQKLGEADVVAENQESLAELLLEEGQPEKAEPLLRQAISEFEKEKTDPDACSAYILLSRALLAMGKTSESADAIHHALDFTKKLTDPALRLPAAIQNARVESAQGKPASARQQLQNAISTAQNLGSYTLACEARLALAEAEIKAGSTLGLKQASLLTSDAHAHGLELVAAKAQQLQKRP